MIHKAMICGQVEMRSNVELSGAGTASAGLPGGRQRGKTMAHLSATMQCLGVGETCQGCERDMKRGEQWNAVEAEDGEPLGWHCDDCIADWRAGREIGSTTKSKRPAIELNTGDMLGGGNYAGPPLLP